MVETVKQYPKYLAFLQLFYPDIYAKLSQYSDKTDIVEAKLICSNNIHGFQAIIFSKDVAQDGELLEVYAGKDSIAPYSWDWRWVFAVKVLFSGNIVFPIKFKQKVIALPTGKNPLTDVFFNILRNEFNTVAEELLRLSIEENLPMPACYAKYCIAVNI